MNREVQAGASATPTPRADAARPVLHFTGRADMVASLLVTRAVAWHAAHSHAQCMDALNRHASLTFTLKEPPRDR